MTTTVVVEEGTVVVSASTVAVTLAAPATDSQVLVLMLVGTPTVSFGTVSLNSSNPRLPLSFADAAGDSACSVLVFHLQDGDQYATARVTSSGSGAVLCWVLLDDATLVPDDWELLSNTVGPGEDPQTVAYTALDTGIQLGVAVILGAEVTILEPYDWTFIADSAGSALSTCFAYGDIFAAGAQIPEFFSGEVPTIGLTGEVYWIPVYGVGLRIREAGTYANGFGVALTRTGPSEPPARQFPPDPTIPNLPPAPTAIVIPTPPWIPPEGGGPYRQS